MSMRKYLRGMIKNQAEKRKMKSSKVVKSTWQEYQIKKYGEKKVVENRLKGTHKKKTWSTRLGIDFKKPVLADGPQEKLSYES